MITFLKAEPKLTILRRYKEPAAPAGFTLIEGDILKAWNHDLNENIHKYIVTQTSTYTEFKRHYS